MKHKVNHRIKIIIFTLIPALVIFFLIEVGLRISYYVKENRNIERKTSIAEIYPGYEVPGVNADTFDKIAKMEYSTFLGYIPLAGNQGNGYKTNNAYFRYSQDIDFIKRNHEFRVFVTGGSAAWATGVDQEKTFCYVAENEARQYDSERLVRVISAGVGAYCSTQERILIENWIINFSPDIIVMFSGWNDAYYGFLGKDILIEQDYLNFKEKIEKGKSNEIKSKPEFNQYRLKIHYYIDKMIYKAFYNKKEQIEREVEARQLPIQKTVDTLLRNVHILSDLSRRYNFRLIFVLQPSIFCTEKKLSVYEQGILNKYTNQFIGFAEYNKKVYLQLKKILPQDSVANNYDFYDADNFISALEETLFVDYVHFGETGNRVLGKKLYRIIKKE